MINDPRYEIIKFVHTPADLILKYLDKLHRHDMLKYRFTDVDNPTTFTVIDLFSTHGDRFHFVFDKERQEIVGEFAISDTISEIGLVHFSMSPDITPHEVFHIIKEGTNEVLSHWKKQDSDEPFLKALVGLTPVENRRACLVIQRCGFKKIAVVPYAGRYLGKTCDALLTIKKLN